MKVKLLNFFFLILLASSARSDELNNDPSSNLSDIVWQLQSRLHDEQEYTKLISQAKKHADQLRNKKIEPENIYDGLLEVPSVAIQEVGPILNSLKDYFVSHAKSSSNYSLSLLGLAMIQDERGLDLIISAIMNSNVSTLTKSTYIAMLALYGEKAKKQLSILDYLQNTEWHPDVKKMIFIVKKKIITNQAKTEWGRYRLWKELIDIRRSFCSYIIEDKYIGFPQSDDSNTNKKNNLLEDDFEYLLSRGYVKEQMLMIWKNIVFFKYIVKMSGRHGEVVAIGLNDKEYIITSGKIKKIDDLFSIGDRLFVVTTWAHSGGGTRFIDELVWDHRGKKYTLDMPRLYLGANYKELIEKDNFYLLKGSDWEYKINKNTGVVESGNICGEDVVINKGL